MNAAKLSDQIVIALNVLYSSAYSAGHHDTVEGNYVDVTSKDAPTYFHDVVSDIVTDPSDEQMEALRTILRQDEIVPDYFECVMKILECTVNSTPYPDGPNIPKELRDEAQKLVRERDK